MTIKYAQILTHFTDAYSRIDSVLIPENTGERKPVFSHISYREHLYESSQNFA